MWILPYPTKGMSAGEISIQRSRNVQHWAMPCAATFGLYHKASQVHAVRERGLGPTTGPWSAPASAAAKAAVASVTKEFTPSRTSAIADPMSASTFSGSAASARSKEAARLRDADPGSYPY